MDDPKPDAATAPAITVMQPGATKPAPAPAASPSAFPDIAMTKKAEGSDGSVRIFVRGDQVDAFRGEGWARE
ncbi:hypothetical protein DK419_13100 [Methylobacterium terrae]|uniref:Uncharacterized protein n=1 Tax=Methylobacterium terrae TaxID=2202827 RepID=A0A2U8WLW2_9HYPH|nr:hypothetical protein [Methylobacterium terrae]AWN47133.1 hypothetical protein DK419_13100 [Methylobacterium terrae]